MNMLNLLIAAIGIALAPTGTNDMTKAVLSADAWDWYESGACEDITIRKNVFRDCLLVRGKGVIQIAPNVKDLKAQRRRYHRNVVIKENVFEQECRRAGAAGRPMRRGIRGSR